MIDSRFFIGAPVSFGGLCNIYSPKVREVVESEKFPFFRQLLLISQEDLEDMKVEGKIKEFMTPFSFLLAQAQENKQTEQLIKEGFEFFIHEPITILYDMKLIIFGDLEKELTKLKSIQNLRVLNEKDYFAFQNFLRGSLGEDFIEPPNPSENARIREIKAKGRRRERAKRKSHSGISLGTLLTAICCMGIGITPLTIGEMSYASISALKDMAQRKEKYEIDVQSLLAGADSKKVHPEYWMAEEKEK